MPTRFLKTDVAKVTDLDLLDDNGAALLEKLAARYKVSVQALTYRLDKLGHIHL